MRDGEGFRAEIKVGKKVHWILLATHSGVGPRAEMHDAKSGKKIAETAWAQDLGDAKKKAEEFGRRWYAAVGLKKPFPALDWEPTG